ncbi:unnamed protein product [Closterium sp. Yama58-4]|nr:unnamed protein product [Closterium sp. Yama58-4]
MAPPRAVRASFVCLSLNLTLCSLFNGRYFSAPPPAALPQATLAPAAPRAPSGAPGARTGGSAEEAAGFVVPSSERECSEEQRGFAIRGLVASLQELTWSPCVSAWEQHLIATVPPQSLLSVQPQQPLQAPQAWQAAPLSASPARGCSDNFPPAPAPASTAASCLAPFARKGDHSAFPGRQPATGSRGPLPGDSALPRKHGCMAEEGCGAAQTGTPGGGHRGHEPGSAAAPTRPRASETERCAVLWSVTVALTCTALVSPASSPPCLVSPHLSGKLLFQSSSTPCLVSPSHPPHPGKLFFQAKDYRAAVADLSPLQDAPTATVDVLRTLGWASAALGAFKAATEVYGRAVKLFPRSPFVVPYPPTMLPVLVSPRAGRLQQWARSGQQQMSALGAFRAATEVYGRAVKLFPQEGALWREKGCSHKELGEVGLARECLETAVAVER